MTEPLTPDERRCFSGDVWRPDSTSVWRLWEAYQAMEARVEEAERKQALDQRQCDEMTSEAARLAQRVTELEARNAMLLESLHAATDRAITAESEAFELAGELTDLEEGAT